MSHKLKEFIIVGSIYSSICFILIPLLILCRQADGAVCKVSFFSGGFIFFGLMVLYYSLFYFFPFMVKIITNTFKKGR